MNPEHLQSAYRVRFDWGLRGAEAVGRTADVAVVVDVLSFTTTLSVALDAGIEVLPYRWHDGGAEDYAARHGAVLAVGRTKAGAGDISLSPRSVRAAKTAGPLVLPSPNGSTIAAELASASGICLGASLRNAHAVAEWIDENVARDATVAVIAGGEKWPTGELRPAVEDLWGAGAVIARLSELGWDSLSPEADVAATAWGAVADDVAVALQNCASGRELIAIDFTSDVDIAAELNSSRSVPKLIGERFVQA